MRIVFFSLCVLCMLPLLSFAENSLASQRDIYISEINFAGSRAYNNCKSISSDNRCGFDKWVEITNRSSEIQSLGGWRLKMNEGKGTNEWFTFPPQAQIRARSSMVIGYSEVNFLSVLTQSGKTADYVTYSMLRSSNNETNQTHIALIDELGYEQDSAYISTFNYGTGENKFTLERVGETWQPSTNEYFSLNFGTPGWDPFLPPTNNQVLMSQQPIPALQTEAETKINTHTANLTGQLEVTVPTLVPKVKTGIRHIGSNRKYECQRNN